MKANWIKKLFQPNWQIISVLETDWKNIALDYTYTVYGYIYYSAIRNKHKYKIVGNKRQRDYIDMESRCLIYIVKKQTK